MQHRSSGNLPIVKTRRDDWTAERQLRFLDALARTGSVTQAAQAAGMTRETAYRLRKRREGALFAAAWDRALKSHTRVTLLGRAPRPRAVKNRANASKVTKWKKYKDARFHSLLAQFRDLHP